MCKEEIPVTSKTNSPDEDGRVSIFHARRLEKYMQITAIGTSIIVLAIAFLLLYYVRSVVIIFALAFLMAYIVSPAVRFFEKRGINRVLIVSVFYLVFVAAVVVSVVLLLPLLWGEVKDLQASIQESIEDPEFKEEIRLKLKAVQKRLSSTFPQLEGIDLNAEESANKAAQWILGYLSQRIGAITIYGGKLVWLIAVMIVIPVITFFLLKDGESIRRAAIKLIPTKHSEVSIELLQKVDRHIGRYIRGRLAESIILSFLTIIGLRILNVKYYLVIGGIAGFANLIPYIGPAMIAIPAIILAYQHGLFRMVMTGIFLGGLQVVDNAILVPLVVGKSVDLHPIVTIFVVFVGGHLLGLLGMIIAVPFTSILIAVFQALYREFKGFSAST